jgi:hypothetical protein
MGLGSQVQVFRYGRQSRVLHLNLNSRTRYLTAVT